MSEEKIGIPTSMQWRFKTIRKLLKETIPMTANNGQATVKPGQRIIVVVVLVMLVVVVVLVMLVVVVV